MTQLVSYGKPMFSGTVAEVDLDYLYIWRSREEVFCTYMITVAFMTRLCDTKTLFYKTIGLGDQCTATCDTIIIIGFVLAPNCDNDDGVDVDVDVDVDDNDVYDDKGGSDCDNLG